MKGFFLIDKESGGSSFKVVAAVRKLTGIRKVGHSGTLDPLATGLLVVAVGEATKLLEYLIGCDKEYETLAEFGSVSDTFDADGKVEAGAVQKKCSKVEVEDALSAFVGNIEQVPPMFSALKIAGRPAYELARNGEELEMKARSVEVRSFDILDFNWPFVRFAVSCSTGTYIRSLVHDLGGVLGCGAYVKELRRLSVGGFNVSDAVLLEDLDIKKDLLSLEKVMADFPRIELSDEEFQGLKDGRVLNKKCEQGGVIMAFYKGKIVGVLEKVNGGVKYKKVIH